MNKTYYTGYYHNTLLIIGVDKKLVEYYLRYIRNLDKKDINISKYTKEELLSDIDSTSIFLFSAHTCNEFYLPYIDIKIINDNFEEFIYNDLDNNININKELLFNLLSKDLLDKKDNKIKNEDIIKLQNALVTVIQYTDKFINKDKYHIQLMKMYFQTHPCITETNIEKYLSMRKTYIDLCQIDEIYDYKISK